MSPSVPNIVLSPVPDIDCTTRPSGRVPSGSWLRSGDSMSMSVKPALSELFTTCVGMCATSDNPTGVIVVSPTVSGVRLVLDLDDCSCVSWEGSCSDTWINSEGVVASCVRTAPQCLMSQSWLPTGSI